MIITWFLDSAYHLHVWEGKYDLDNQFILESLEGKELKVIYDEAMINDFFERIYGFERSFMTPPYFLCDEWGSTLYSLKYDQAVKTGSIGGMENE